MRRLILFVGALTALACGSSGTVAPNDADFSGTYSLQSIDGTRLPYVVLQSGTTSISVVSDQLTIAAGGSWIESGTYQTKQSGQTTNNVGGDQGTWLRSGNTLILHSTKDNQTAYSGTFTANRLDFVYNTSLSSTSYIFTR